MNIFELYATLGLKADEFNKGLDKALEMAENFGKGVDKVLQKAEEFGAAFEKVSESAGSVMNAVSEMADSAGDSMESLIDAAGDVQGAFDELTIGDKLLVIIQICQRVIEVLMEVWGTAVFLFESIIEKTEELGLAIEESLILKVVMFGEKFEEIKDIIIGVFEDLSRKAQDILRRMMSDIDSFLRSSGFLAGRNFFRAIGDGLIAEEGRLMAEAMRVADALVDIFRARQQEATGMRAFSMSGAEFAYSMGDFVRLPHDESGVNLGGDTIVNQNFYGVKEKETAFQAYRAAQKAIRFV